jgi:hypothetical protein
MGQYARVQEFRSYYQDATRQLFIEVVEELVGRQVMAFASATDARAEVIWEIFEFGAPTEPG